MEFQRIHNLNAAILDAERLQGSAGKVGARDLEDFLYRHVVEWRRLRDERLLTLDEKTRTRFEREHRQWQIDRLNPPRENVLARLLG